MKTKTIIWPFRLLALGIILILTSHCRKDLTDTLIIIQNDSDSVAYSTVTIGTQVWMTHNLKVRRYRNVEKVVTTTPATLDISSEAAPKYHWAYNGEESNADTYGRLYTWYTATDKRNLCPRGWHLPSDKEWTELIALEAMGGEEAGGGKLKESGYSHWIAPNSGATNETGFSALPGGYHFNYGSFRDLGFSGYWWSSTESSESTAFAWGVSSYNSKISRFIFNKRDGLSVRCIMDN